MPRKTTPAHVILQIKQVQETAKCYGGETMLYIGIDLGTSASKFLLVDEVGRVLNTVTKEYPLSFPRPGWSEQDPGQLPMPRG